MIVDEVEEFILNYEGGQKETLLFFHNLMISLPEITAKIRYKIPFYYRKSWICYLNPTKDGKVEFAFTRGNELSNEQGLLDSKGRRQVFSVTFSSIIEIPEAAILEVIQEAILLDETVRYTSTRKR